MWCLAKVRRQPDTDQDCKDVSVLFQPLQGVRFADPDSDGSDGVLDLSPCICSSIDVVKPPEADRPYDVRRLATQPAMASTWMSEGRLARDPLAAFYLYRLGYSDDHGLPAQCTAVWGELVGTSARSSLSPLLLTPAPTGLTDVAQPTGLPLARATDRFGYHHRVWAITQTGVMDVISSAAQSVIPAQCASGLALLSEISFDTATSSGHTVADVVALGLVMALTDTV